MSASSKTNKWACNRSELFFEINGEDSRIAV